MTDLLWTLDELTGRVAEALADGYPGAPSARVRDLPDARTVRWYTTRGLVDPPLAMRGRQALYGQRHLLQLVALKRRQAAGAPLAVIQTELAGLPDAALAVIAALPPSPAGPRSGPVPGPVTGPVPGTPAGGSRVRFWAAPAHPITPVAPAVSAASPDLPAPSPEPLATAPSNAAVNGTRNTVAINRARNVDGRSADGESADERLERLHGIRLAPGVVLLLDADLAANAHLSDDAALRAAAVPLLSLLGLLQGDPTNDGDSADQDDPTDEGTRR